MFKVWQQEYHTAKQEHEYSSTVVLYSQCSNSTVQYCTVYCMCTMLNCTVRYATQQKFEIIALEQWKWKWKLSFYKMDSAVARMSPTRLLYDTILFSLCSECHYICSLHCEWVSFLLPILSPIIMGRTSNLLMGEMWRVVWCQWSDALDPYEDEEDPPTLARSSPPTVFTEFTPKPHISIFTI